LNDFANGATMTIKLRGKVFNPNAILPCHNNPLYLIARELPHLLYWSSYFRLIRILWVLSRGFRVFTHLHVLIFRAIFVLYYLSVIVWFNIG
jgi:hypothetical protein